MRGGRLPPRLFVKIKPLRKRYRGEAADLDSSDTGMKELTQDEIRLKDLMLRIGQGNENEIPRNIESFAPALESDLERHSAFIHGMLLECASNMPQNAAIYACLIAVVAKSKPEFGKSFVDHLSFEIQEYIDSAQTHTTSFRSIVRLACCLHNVKVISEESLFDCIKICIEVARRSPAQASDRTLYSILASLVWLDLLWDTNSERVESIIADCQKLMASRNSFLFLDRLRENNGKKAREDSLERLWRLIKTRKESKRPIVVPTPHVKLKSSFAGLTSLDLKISGENAKKLSQASYIHPIQYPFAMFVKKMDEKATELERVVVSNILSDILDLFKDKPKVVALVLNQLKFQIPYRHLIIESILGSLLEMPRAPNPPPWYGALLYELLRKDGKTYAPLFAMAINSVYVRAGRVDTEVLDRIASYFALHISNFKYQWPWNKWQSVMEMDELDEKRIFVSEILRSCVRLSRLRIYTLPSVFAPIEPPRPSTRYYIDIKLPNDKKGKINEKDPSEEDDDDEEDGKDNDKDEKDEMDVDKNKEKSPSVTFKPMDAFDDLCDLFHDRRKAALITQWLENLSLPSDETNPEIALIPLKLFLSAFLETSKASISHFVNLLARYGPQLRSLITSAKHGAEAVRIVADFHSKDDSRFVIVAGKLMHSAILHPTQVIYWSLLSTDEPLELMRYVRFEVLKEAINRMLHRKSLALSRNLDVDDMGKQRSGTYETVQQEVKKTFIMAFKCFSKSILRLQKAKEAKTKGSEKLLEYTHARLREFGRWFATDIRPFLNDIQKHLDKAAPSFVKEELKNLHTFCQPDDISEVESKGNERKD